MNAMGVVCAGLDDSQETKIKKRERNTVPNSISLPFLLS